MKILVLGSTGLVGSSIVRNFEKNKNFSKIISPTRRTLNLFDFNNVKKFIIDTKPDVIVNAAAKVGGILANNTYRADFILENLKINTNLLEAIINFPQIKVINLGSSCIYPLNASNPIKESSILTGELEKTNSPYAMAKLAAIELGKSISFQYGHKIINLMPTNLYGPNDNFSEKDSHVIPGLMGRMHKSKITNESSFTVWGTGKPLREFLYVDDLSDAINFILENNIEDELINIGSGGEVSIKSLVTTLMKIIKYNGDIIFDDKYPDGNPRKLLDSSKINSYGWFSKTNLEKGLELTYESFLKKI